MKMNPGKTIFVLAVCMALQMTGFVIIFPLFARRFTELGAGVAALGTSEMVYALTSTLAAPFMGALADRFGRKPLVLVSLAAYVAAFCGYLLAQSAETFIFIRGLAGALTAGLIPAVTGLAADVAPKDHQAQWMGFINGGASFGWIAGPIAGGLIYDRWGYSAALMVSIGMTILTFLVALLYIPGNHLSERSLKETKSSQARNRESFLTNLRSTLPKSLSAFLVLLFIVFAVLFAWAFIEPRLMFYAYNDLGWSSTILGLVMSTYGIAMMIGELFLGGLSDRLGRKPVILLGLILFSAQFLGLAFFKNFILIAVSFAIGGLGNALYDPAINAAILDISPKEYCSRILGIKSMVGSAGTILGPGLVALLSPSMDARSIFLFAVGAVFLTTLAGLAYPARKRLDIKGSDPATSVEATPPLIC
jgi:DHA1 family multidrug resistance protein-like MFS transporter